MEKYRSNRPLSQALMLCLGFILIISTFPVFSSGGDANEYTTIVLTENKFFKVGDDVTLEVRFYNKDNAVDADYVNTSIGMPEYGMERYVEDYTRTGTGVYEVTFTIEEGDDPMGFGMIIGNVRCGKSVSRSEKNDTMGFFLPLEHDEFLVKVTPDKPIFEAGDTVTFDVVITYDESRVDPDEISARLRINGEYQDVSLVHDDTGEYHYDYAAPMDTESKEVKLYVDADYQDKDYENDGEANLNYYQIWLHTENITETGLIGEIGVADLEGNPIVADIDLMYRYQDSEDEDVEKEIHDRTGSDGLLDVTLDYSDIGDRGQLEVIMWANGSGSRDGPYQQYAHKDFYVLGFSPDEPDSEGFDIIAQEEILLLPQDTEVTLDYIAYWNGTPLDSKDIYYYFYSSSMMLPGMEPDSEIGEMIHVGMKATDAEGKFSVTVTTPDKSAMISILFKADFEETREGDGDWELDQDGFFVGSLFEWNEDISMDVSNFGLGQVATVTVTKTGQDGGRGGAAVNPVPSTITEEDMFDFMFMGDNTGWTQITEGELIFEVEFTGDHFSKDIGIPSFFSTDDFFLIMGGTVKDMEVELGMFNMTYIVVDKDGVEQDLGGQDKLKVTTDAPSTMDSEEETDITVIVNGSGPIENAEVTIEVEGAGDSDTSSGKTDSNGEVTFSLAADNATGEDKTITLWINATKDGYEDGHYKKTITVKAYMPPKDMHIATDLPDTLGSEEYVEMTIDITGSPGIEGVDVTLETTGPGHTCKTDGVTDGNGQVLCSLTADNVTGEDATITVYINGTKEGYNNAYYTKNVIVKAWKEPGEDKDITITTNLPDTMTSKQVAPLTVTVTGSPAIPGVSITLQTAGPGHTCKSSGVTDGNGKVSCSLSIDNVTGEDTTITVWINGTKEGYNDAFYEKIITIIAWNPPEPENVTEPIEVDLGDNVSATVTAGVVGNVTIVAQGAVQPDQNDPNTLGIYLDITMTGDGTLNWVYIEIDYDDIPEGIDPTRLKMYFWDGTNEKWVKIVNSGVDTVNKIVWANVTHLTIFAPRQVEADNTPPVINHTPVTEAEEETAITIKAAITDVGDGVQEAKLYYRKSGTTGYTTITMTKVGESYEADIPADDVTTDDIEYYIYATDGTNTATHPADKANPHKIDVGGEEEESSGMPGFGVIMALAAISLAGILYRRKRS